MHILVYNIIFQNSSNYTKHKSSGNSLHRSYSYRVYLASRQVTQLNPQPTMRTPDITPSESRDHRLICTYPHGNPECQMSLRTSVTNLGWVRGSISHKQ